MSGGFGGGGSVVVRGRVLGGARGVRLGAVVVVVWWCGGVSSVGSGGFGVRLGAVVVVVWWCDAVPEGAERVR